MSLATEGVRALHPYQPGKPVEELQRELGLDDVIKLASNENSLGAGAKAVAAGRDALAEAERYPDGNGFALKQGLAEQLQVPVECLTLGNGSNDVLELLARAFVTPQHEVVFSAHAFAVYPIVTQAVGARAVITPAQDWGHDLPAMAAAINENTRLVFVANPNNPTGTWVSSDALQAFLEQVPAHVIAVVDEAYFEYVDESAYPDTVPWVERYTNLVVTRTFSKIHGLAALRIGYGVSHPQVADLLNRVRQPFNVNSVALAAARGALDDGEHVQRSRSTNLAGMKQLTAAFSRLGLEFIPSVGNFVCVDVGRPCMEVYDGLLRQGVIVRPVANYGMPNFLRVTVGTETENQRFVAALESVLNPAANS